jgi:hypothetical protein
VWRAHTTNKKRRQNILNEEKKTRKSTRIASFFFYLVGQKLPSSHVAVACLGGCTRRPPKEVSLFFVGSPEMLVCGWPTHYQTKVSVIRFGAVKSERVEFVPTKQSRSKRTKKFDNDLLRHTHKPNSACKFWPMFVSK